MHDCVVRVLIFIFTLSISINAQSFDMDWSDPTNPCPKIEGLIQIDSFDKKNNQCSYSLMDQSFYNASEVCSCTGYKEQKQEFQIKLSVFNELCKSYQMNMSVRESIVHQQKNYCIQKQFSCSILWEAPSKNNINITLIGPMVKTRRNSDFYICSIKGFPYNS